MDSSKLQEQAKDLLASKQVDIIIGYEKGYDDFQARPVFISNTADVDKLILNEYCTNNLAVYLPIHRKLKVGIVATKERDLASIHELIKEHQIPEENVVIIDAKEGTEACRGGFQTRPKGTEDDKAVEEFEKLSAKEREAFWNKEFDRCIRCYACRQVCPVCYCPDCFVNRTMPKYLNEAVDRDKNKLFSLVRMMHVFGRCTDCRACDNACPVGIPLHLLTKKIAMDALELFEYTSGQGQEHPFSTFKKDELLEGII
ncbi:4Fe-4S dicluster domain-containing protein [Candidatus Desantisbacteria bacterium]|nr:4Fe-4S dicluster domain-containing protein [Candidatus Desantisbacteria bacterium]